jgi:flagellar biosynthetic protein FlhB
MSVFQELWQPRDTIDIATAVYLLKVAFGAGSKVVLPILIAVVFAVVLMGLVQTRGNFSTYKLKPQFKKLNPATNIKRIVKTQGVIELGKSLVKVAVVGGVIVFTISRHVEDYPGLSRLPLFQIIGIQFGTVFEAYLAGIVALIFLALADYSWQIYQTEKGLKMSKTEVKEESRQAEGDPQVKGKLRGLMADKSRTRMIDQVPKADVVVTNPRHVAVALIYKRDQMSSPKVVAKGAGFLAAKIKEVAAESGIPIVESPPLARALFRSVKVGRAIPDRLFQAVAEILAHVYRLDRSRASAW